MLARSPLINSGSGKCGDLIATRHHEGFYLKKFTSPDQPWTQRQIDRYTAFSDTNLRWMSLTEAQRQSWRLYAKAVSVRNTFGQPHFISGRNQYTRTNIYRNLIAGGVQWIDDAPTIWQLAFPLLCSSFTATIDASGDCTLHLTFESLQYAAAAADGSFYFVSSTGPLTEDRFYCVGPFIEIASIALPDSGPFNKDLAVGPAAGWDTGGSESVFIQVVVSMKDGRTSCPFFFRALTAPE